MKKRVLVSMLVIALVMSVFLISSPVSAFEGPNYQGHETVNDSRITTYEEMKDELYKNVKKSKYLDIEVIG